LDEQSLDVSVQYSFFKRTKEKNITKETKQILLILKN